MLIDERQLTPSRLDVNVPATGRVRLDSYPERKRTRTECENQREISGCENTGNSVYVYKW